MNEQLLRDHAYIIAQATAAMIEAMGMQAENAQRLQNGESIAYDAKAFNDLNNNYGLYHNSVMSTFFPK